MARTVAARIFTDCPVVCAGGYNGCTPGQIVKQRVAALKEQWQIVLGTTTGAAGADFRVHRAGIVIDIETVIPVMLEAMDGFGVQGELPRRHSTEFVNAIDGRKRRYLTGRLP